MFSAVVVLYYIVLVFLAVLGFEPLGQPAALFAAASGHDFLEVGELDYAGAHSEIQFFRLAVKHLIAFHEYVLGLVV